MHHVDVRAPLLRRCSDRRPVAATRRSTPFTSARRVFRIVALAALCVPGIAAAQLNLYCSSPNTAWCQGMAVGFEKASGTHVAVIQKATGEMFAQIKAEAANPKGDVWWAGPADAYLQAAEEGLLDEYRSPNLSHLRDWAQRISTLSHGRVSGVYGGIIALGYNTEVVARRKLPVPKCWKDLTNPVYRGEIMLGNPNSSGTAYLMLATLVQVFGEDAAFQYLRDVHPNVNQYARSGIGPMTAVTRGETAIGSTVLHGVINEIVRGAPVQAVLPCEGVGYEVGSVAIIKGTRHPEASRKFVDWALSVEGQAIGLDVHEYAIPTNRSVPLPPQVPPLESLKVIDYDFAKYGSSAERKQLLERWEKDIGAAR